MPTDMFDDDAFIAEFLAGREETVRIVRTWIERIVRYGGWSFRDPDEVVQEIVYKVFALLRADRFRKQSAFKTFVHAVSRYTCIDYHRANKLRPEIQLEGMPADDEPVAAANSEQVMIERQRLDAFRYIFQKMSGECRRLWQAVYFEGLSMAQVGSAFGISEVNARVRVHRCLEKARNIGRELLEVPPPLARGGAQ